MFLRCKTTQQLLRTNFHHRKLSATAIAQLDGPTASDYITWVGRGASPVPLLHETLKRCAKTGRVGEGLACHARIITAGLCSDTLTSNMVVSMYSKCGSLGNARKVFEEMPERSVVSWNIMIGSLARCGQEREALGVFLRMTREGHCPVSGFTVSSVLCACAGKAAVLECRQLHAFAVKMAMNSNVYVGTALLDVYAKCGFVKEAGFVFESMPEKNVVTWSSMVAGCVQSAFHEEALVLFCRARVVGIETDEFLISSAVCACAGIASMIEGGQVHAVVCKAGFGSNVFVASSLVDMYAKCGSIGEAYTLFRYTEGKNVVLWNSMISGFARHAHSLEAMILCEKMQQTGLFPNEITYISVLSACSHMGLVKNGRKYFEIMRRVHSVSPSVVHYSTMVDILSRAGLIDEAHNLIKTMPFDATAPMWGSLLASCRIHKNLQMAEMAAEHLFKMEPDNAGNHVLLSNVYAANEKWEEVARTRKLLKDSDAKKERGKSWIEIKNTVHSFMVGERNHPRTVEIYAKLEELIEDLAKLGYTAKTEDDLHNVEKSRKNELLRHHSEKLALAFGLMCLPQKAPIRIMKNLRICGDCHSFMKIASGFTGREIIVRDTYRFHHFKNVYCSCREFW